MAPPLHAKAPASRLSNGRQVTFPLSVMQQLAGKAAPPRRTFKVCSSPVWPLSPKEQRELTKLRLEHLAYWSQFSDNEKSVFVIGRGGYTAPRVRGAAPQPFGKDYTESLVVHDGDRIIIDFNDL
jgi:hypothetical protein